MFNFFGNMFSFDGSKRNSDKGYNVQKFDERKEENAENIQKIEIDSSIADINVLSNQDSNQVAIHLYGELNINGDVNFNVSLENHTLKVLVEHEGDYYDKRLTLDVILPGIPFKEISAKSSSANISFSKNISTNILKVESRSGDIDIGATFTTATVSQFGGDVDLDIDAREDIFVKISTIRGDICAKFNNIEKIDLSSKTMSGMISNTHKSEASGYIANLNVSTVSGNIIIK